MANESMQLGEGFSATVQRGGTTVETKPRHHVIGWALILSLLLGMGYAGVQYFGPAKPAAMEEKPGFKEMLGHKFGGVLYYDVIRAAINLPKEWDLAAQMAVALTGKQFEHTHFGPIPNTIVNEGENVLADCFENNLGSACANVANFEFHGIGTSSTAITEADGGCITELTTQYNPDNTRATGSQTNNGANVYRTVGTNTVDASATIEEFCLMDVNTGAANMWTRILTGTVSLAASDSLQTTYDLTIE